MVASNAGKDNENDEIVVDYRGNPVDRSRTGRWLAAGLILGWYFLTKTNCLPKFHLWQPKIFVFVVGTEFAERICVIGIAMNLVTYLVGYMHLSSSKSATIVTNFMGTLNLLALLAGFLADAKLGRYLTIAIFASIAAVVSFGFPTHIC